MRKGLLWAALASGLAAFTPPAAAVPIPVIADSSVQSVGPDDNLGSNTFRGGLFSGGAGDGHDVRFYLKFQLPAFVSGTHVSQAILSGYYQDDLFADIDSLHSLYFVPDDSWTEGGITWNNQPGSTGGALASWDATGKSFGLYSFDITALVNQEYQGDGMLSLLFREVDESNTLTWEYWRARESIPDVSDPDKRPFQIDVTIEPVPEPGSAALLALGLLALAARRRSA